MGLIYMGSRKAQDLLNKLGASGSWERVEEREEKKYILLNKTIRKRKTKKEKYPAALTNIIHHCLVKIIFCDSGAPTV